jgi:hypothetical protein
MEAFGFPVIILSVAGEIDSPFGCKRHAEYRSLTDVRNVRRLLT